jgi:hypothetical protein
MTKLIGVRHHSALQTLSAMLPLDTIQKYRPWGLSGGEFEGAAAVQLLRLRWTKAQATQLFGAHFQ